jgi:hypothetical protein
MPLPSATTEADMSSPGCTGSGFSLATSVTAAAPLGGVTWLARGNDRDYPG